MTRRSLIQRALLVLGIHWPGVIGCASRRDPDMRPTVWAPSGPPSTNGGLSRAEMADLVAFGEVLLEGRTLAPTERRYLVEHIEDRTTRSADYLSLYRTAATILDRLAGRRFATLEVRERIDLITRHRLAPVQGAAQAPSDEMRTLRTQVVPDLIRGYYGSPAGWAAVGYDTFPGRCGELTRYTRPGA